MKLKKGKWYLFCDAPVKGEEPEWVGRYLDGVFTDDKGRVSCYGTYILNPNGSKNSSGGFYDYCIPVPKLPKVKLK
jgi:hypothetical protein